MANFLSVLLSGRTSQGSAMATSPNLIVAIVFALLTVASSHVYFEERFEGNHTFLSSLLIFRCMHTHFLCYWINSWSNRIVSVFLCWIGRRIREFGYCVSWESLSDSDGCIVIFVSVCLKGCSFLRLLSFLSIWMDGKDGHFNFSEVLMCFNACVYVFRWWQCYSACVAKKFVVCCEVHLYRTNKKGFMWMITCSWD